MQNDGRAYSFCGTIEYMAPEIVKGGQKGHGMVSDMIFLVQGLRWTHSRK